MIKLDFEMEFILKRLQTYGKGYIVGGYIRDYLLGIEPKDCDFVTDLDYSILKNLFIEYSPKEMGKSFGIIQITINGKKFEIAKMRKDIGIPANRKEQSVEFINDIYEDLKRRDFTINAIAYDGEKFYYTTHSKEDIKNSFLRFVGECSIRIEEDPLRILRFFRFLACKNLDFDTNSLKAITEKNYLIKKITPQRIKVEMDKILLSHNCTKILEMMKSSNILQFIYPFNVEINLSILDNLENNIILKLCFLYFHMDISIVKGELLKFNYSKQNITTILKITSTLHRKIKKYETLITTLHKNEIFYYLDLAKEFKIIQETEQMEIIKKMENYIELSELCINGKILTEEFSIPQGKEIQKILNYLLFYVRCDKSLNTFENLSSLIKNYYKTKN